MQPAQLSIWTNKVGSTLQVTAILAAGHHLPFEVKGVSVDLPELQVRNDLVRMGIDHPVRSIDRHTPTAANCVTSEIRTELQRGSADFRGSLRT